MNFSFKPSPHIRNKQTTDQIMNYLLLSLIFVAIWGIYNQYSMFGQAIAIDAILVILVTCIAATLTHFVFNVSRELLDNKKHATISLFAKSHAKQAKSGVPLITGLILALMLPAGTPLFVAAFSAIFAEIFAKILFGGFGQNIFNPAATGRVFATVTFGSLLVVPKIADSVSAATPLVNAASQGWVFSAPQGLSYVEAYGGFSQMLLGTVPGAIGETARLAILIAMVFLIITKVIDWVVPVFFIGTVFIISWFVGMLFGLGIWYAFFHVLSGGLLFGAVFMATDPVTNPINRQGRIIFAILLGMFTLLLRFASNYPEGVMFAIMLMNMFVPLIDQKTANVTTINTNKKWMTIVVTFVIAVAIIFSFTYNLEPTGDEPQRIQAVQ